MVSPPRLSHTFHDLRQVQVQVLPALIRHYIRLLNGTERERMQMNVTIEN